MAADARNLYNSMTAAAVEAGPRLHPDQPWPLLVLVAHGDAVTPLLPPEVHNQAELMLICGGWIPTQVLTVPTRPHAIAMQWPAPEHGREAVHVLALEPTVAWQSAAVVNRRDVARLHPILADFPEPKKIPDPATADTARHFAHRTLLFSLGLVT